MYYLEAYRNDGWTLIGQYRTRDEAERIAADYRRRGERVRITSDD